MRPEIARDAPMRLTFHGAAGEVTGSCYLVDTGEVKFLASAGGRRGRKRGALE